MPSTMLNTADMECSWFPELWIHKCCTAHDLTNDDLGLFGCVWQETLKVSHSNLLSVIFAFLILFGMILFRPLRMFCLQRLSTKPKDKEGDRDDGTSN